MLLQPPEWVLQLRLDFWWLPNLWDCYAMSLSKSPSFQFFKDSLKDSVLQSKRVFWRLNFLKSLLAIDPCRLKGFVVKPKILISWRSLSLSVQENQTLSLTSLLWLIQCHLRVVCNVHQEFAFCSTAICAFWLHSTSIWKHHQIYQFLLLFQQPFCQSTLYQPSPSLTSSQHKHLKIFLQR